MGKLGTNFVTLRFQHIYLLLELKYVNEFGTNKHLQQISTAKYLLMKQKLTNSLL